MLFHELKDALLHNGCPICFLAQRSVDRNISSIFHEMVNDVRMVAKIKRSGGFCEKHSEQILKTKESLGIAIIYQRLINFYISILQKSGVFNKMSACPLCETYSESEERYLSLLLDHWDEFKNDFNDTTILCINHFRMAMDIAGKQSNLKKELIDAEVKKLKNLSIELGEFCRKYDYRFKDEKWGKEKDSWQRAVKLISIVMKQQSDLKD